MAIGQEFDAGLRRRHMISRAFELACLLATVSSLIALTVLLGGILWKASGWLGWTFLTSYDSHEVQKAGLLAGIWGTFWLVMLTAIVSVPVGVGAAVYLEEYASDSWLNRLIKVNLANLAGVPSIVYGILGLTAFVYMFHLFPDDQTLNIGLLGLTIRIPLPFGRTVIAGALTLSLLILPVVIIASQEALRAVPPSIRHASYALGATHWQTIRHQVLPASLPGIATGVILSLSRAMGETAPLLMIGALSYVRLTPGGIEGPADLISNPEGVLNAPFDRFTCIPIQIFNWVSKPQSDFEHVAAAGILVLLVALLFFNAIAIMIRNHYQKKINW